jgi:hypothetical protein
MKLLDRDETILLVTGSSEAAGQKDAPLAVWLREEIDRRGSGVPFRRGLMVEDSAYVGTPSFHENPTIAIGGPGSNAVVQHLSDVLPTVWAREDKSFIQMGVEGRGRQVALWGMDADGTRGAVEAFVEEGMLDALLERVWSFKPLVNA